MYHIPIGIFIESLHLLNTMSPYILFGFLFAVILHIFIQKETIAKHLGKSSLTSVIEASLLGIPLPLCSCSVIPTALSLRKEGASKGAILSFLISTPTTGIDSIFATYSLLGGIFTLYRIIASFCAGVCAGILTNIFDPQKEPATQTETAQCPHCESSLDEQHTHTLIDKITHAFHSVFIDLLGDIGIWLIVGILIGGTISYLIPEHLIHTYIGSGWKAMIIMLLIGIPLYVCATGSIPIAAVLLLKGINPGAAFVFLFAGPATNTITMTIVSQSLGKKTLFMYLFTIIISALGFGFLLDYLWPWLSIAPLAQSLHQHDLMPDWIKITSSCIVLALIVYTFCDRCKIGDFKNCKQ